MCKPYNNNNNKKNVMKFLLKLWLFILFVFFSCLCKINFTFWRKNVMNSTNSGGKQLTQSFFFLLLFLFRPIRWNLIISHLSIFHRHFATAHWFKNTDLHEWEHKCRLTVFSFYKMHNRTNTNNCGICCVFLSCVVWQRF